MPCATFHFRVVPLKISPWRCRADWQAHCEAAHIDDADFDYLCTEIEVVEVVATEQED